MPKNKVKSSQFASQFYHCLYRESHSDNCRWTRFLNVLNGFHLYAVHQRQILDKRLLRCYGSNPKPGISEKNKGRVFGRNRGKGLFVLIVG